MAFSYPRASRRLRVRFIQTRCPECDEDGATLYTVQRKARWWSPWIEYGTTHTLNRAMDMLKEIAIAYAREER
jgi:hypothetical protein